MNLLRSWLEQMNRDRLPLLAIGINFIIVILILILSSHKVNKLETILFIGIGIISIASWFILGRGKTYEKYLEKRQKEVNYHGDKPRGFKPESRSR